MAGRMPEAQVLGEFIVVGLSRRIVVDTERASMCRQWVVFSGVAIGEFAIHKRRDEPQRGERDDERW